MKKTLFLLALSSILLFFILPALADEAADITGQCEITVSNAQKSLASLTDGDYDTFWTSSHRGYIEIAAPEGEAIHGLYVSWSKFITDWCIQAPAADGSWQTVYTTEDQFYNQYIPLTDGYQRVRLTCLSPDYDHAVNVSELHVLGAGDVPSWVQQWKNFTGKADLVLLVTDPGDEYLFFGGLLPYYVAQGKEVMLCVIVNTSAVYKNQMLDGLWHCGMTNYPYIAYFKPRMYTSLREQYNAWSEIQFVRHVTRIVRIYEPDVLVTHAVDGEGIDGGHKACADAAMRAVTAAMDSKYDIGYGVELFGNWQLKKLYLHQYGSTRTTLDYSVPLDFFGGKTALEIAREAYAMQDYQKTLAKELPADGIFDGASFGLQFSDVGADEACNDLFENIP